MSFFLTLIVFLIAGSTALRAADRITTHQGWSIECKIIDSRGAEVVYRKDDKVHRLPKSRIKKIELDFDADKYFRAALKVKDEKKKIRYLIRSITDFPHAGYNRRVLAKIHIRRNELTKAETVLGGAYPIIQALINVRREQMKKSAALLDAVKADDLSPELKTTYHLIRAIHHDRVGDYGTALSHLASAKARGSAAYAAELDALTGVKDAAAFEAAILKRDDFPTDNDTVIANLTQVTVILRRKGFDQRLALPGFGKTGSPLMKQSDETVTALFRRVLVQRQSVPLVSVTDAVNKDNAYPFCADNGYGGVLLSTRRERGDFIVYDIRLYSAAEKKIVYRFMFKTLKDNPMIHWARRRSIGMRHGGVEFYYPFYLSRNLFLTAHFPGIGGLGVGFHFPLRTLLTLYARAEWLGLFNGALQNPPDLVKSGALNMVYFHSGARGHVTLMSLFDLYVQGGFNLLYFDERAESTAGESGVNNFLAFGLSGGTGIKIMITEWVGLYGEGIYCWNPLGTGDDLSAVEVNAGLYIGFLR